MRMDLVQEERKQLIREVCHGDKEALLEKEIGYNKYHHLIVDNAHGIIYCFVPKVQHIHTHTPTRFRGFPQQKAEENISLCVCVSTVWL